MINLLVLIARGKKMKSKTIRLIMRAIMYPCVLCAVLGVYLFDDMSLKETYDDVVGGFWEV